MRRQALEFIACPNCLESLSLSKGAVEEADGHVMVGELICKREGCRFQLKEGVPVLLASSVEDIKVETADRFAEEWTRWSELRDYYEKQFLGWVAPIAREDFAGKVVFEGGCGKGRHTSVVVGFGAKAVVGVDLGASAFVAFKNTRDLPNAHVVVGDLLNPPVIPVFDLAFSVGVIHHLPNPAEGFKTLSSVVRPGGRVVVWVYGKENNEWIITWVDPVRKALTAKLGPATLRVLSAVPAAGLRMAIRFLYKPDAEGKGPRLPYGDYFASMHDFPFDEIHSIVFDQLVTPVAHYLTGDEVKRWFDRGFRDVNVRWHNRYSWTGTAVVEPKAAAGAL